MDVFFKIVFLLRFGHSKILYANIILPFIFLESLLIVVLAMSWSTNCPNVWNMTVKTGLNFSASSWINKLTLRALGSRRPLLEPRGLSSPGNVCGHYVSGLALNNISHFIYDFCDVTLFSVTSHIDALNVCIVDNFSPPPLTL